MSEHTTLNFTGERYIPGTAGNIELEHLHRYLLASELCTGKTVLDVASGEGYGSAMIAGKAALVIGVDISEQAVTHARARYRAGNLEYRTGDCTAIPLPDASVDAVVSFETIEHHDRHAEMIGEIRRVLKPGGVLLMSSPDKYYYSEKPGTANAHHVKELYEDEFKALIEGSFRHVCYYGQTVAYGSVILAQTAAATQTTYWKEAGELRRAQGLAMPLFWLAVASDAELPALQTGLFEQAQEESELVRLKQRDIDNAVAMLTAKDRSLAEAAGMLRLKDEHLAHAAEMLRLKDEHLAQAAEMLRLKDEHLAQAAELIESLKRPSGVLNRARQKFAERFKRG